MPAMSEDILSHNHRAPYKTRSSSISAPPNSSLEAIICQGTIDNGNNSENSTPDYRRRKPAARSQSARITGVRSVRKFFIIIISKIILIINLCLLGTEKKSTNTTEFK